MDSGTLLLLLLLVPLVGAIVCALLPNARLAKTWALGVSLVTLAVALALGPAGRQAGGAVFAPASWNLNGLDFGFKLGSDAITYWLVLLTTVLQPLAVAASFASIRDRQRQYYAWMLALLFAMLGVFVARDVLLFYVFFELTLVPMFFIIGLWGGPERRHAAGKFFLFTFAGSVFTLAAAVYVGMRAGSFDIADCVRFAQTQMTATERYWVFLGFLAGFAVKVPLFPVHTWLPLAHTEAPTAGSVILAGVLLKLGTYGLLRLALPFGLVGVDVNEVIYRGHLVPGPDWLPFAVTFDGLIAVLGVLCVVGVVYGALVAWVQQDIKKLVAYSSVSHLGFCVLGLLALNEIGIQGSILYMINHGISTGAMFLVIGMVYDRFHTRDINALSGLARRMPVMAFFFVFFVLSSIGLPGLNGFVSEFLTILGAFQSDRLGIAFGSVAALGIVLGAVYMLHMTAKVIFGPLKFPAADHGHAEGNQADGGHGAGSSAHASGHAAGHGASAVTTTTPTSTTAGHTGTTATAAAGHADAHGSREDADHPETLPRDLSAREVSILVPLALAAVILGVRPGIVMDDTSGEVNQLRTAATVSATPAPREVTADAGDVARPAPSPAAPALAAAAREPSQGN
ncbi:MAG: NADH-ubiquinone oxidoreductase chain M [uncultured Phycisphaerae bacterium]|uniref:NADH-ubiquinone oxidoreductase chain M n=1 Tax=uncultured Phycisphaerae bacterium TaxID=904963 RepID=A0A6J4PP13_9BACT|nr:MAG: NADH-ubiquinone oxidoreductase chain M [uncultured Phycisphaerae bacterium]